MSVQASQVVAAIEQLSKASVKGLEDALALVQRVETTRATEISTAQDALGPAYAATVVELARVSTAERTGELLRSIRDLASALLGEEPVAALPGREAAAQAAPQVPEPAPVRQRVFAPPPQQGSSRSEMYGVQFPASRREEAEDVVAQVRKAIAQGHKSNPFDSYRGKNQWCKKLFDMAYATLSTAGGEHASGADEDAPPSAPAPVQTAPAAPTPAAAGDPPSTPQAAPQRASLTMSGPARGIRNRFGPPATPTPQTGSVLRDPSSGRRFGNGVVTQTIDTDIAGAPAPTRESFYKRKK